MNTQPLLNYAQSHPEELLIAQQQLSSVLSRSATDPAFRQKLLTEPRAAIAEFSDLEIPDALNIAFVENRAGATIVLPDPISVESDLSEAELEAVAGGDNITQAVFKAAGWLWGAWVESNEGGAATAPS